MDNTDKKKRIVLFQQLVNKQTGETITRVKPKPKSRKKIIVAKGKGTKTVGKILLARLYPLRFALDTGLRRKGINTTGLSFQTLVIMYYNAFSGNKPVVISDFINNPVFKLRPSDNPSGDLSEARNQTAMVQVNDIVFEVMNIFKRAYERYRTLNNMGLDPKQNMTVEEFSQAKAAIKVKNQLIREASEDHFLKASDFVKTLKWIAGIILFFYILKNL